MIQNVMKENKSCLRCGFFPMKLMVLMVDQVLILVYRCHQIHISWQFMQLLQWYFNQNCKREPWSIVTRFSSGPFRGSWGVLTERHQWHQLIKLSCCAIICWVMSHEKSMEHCGIWLIQHITHTKASQTLNGSSGDPKSTCWEIFTSRSTAC